MVLKKKQFLIGESDYKTLIEEKAYLIDKTLLIQKVIESPNRVLLLPRPRRFGKTTNLSMLRYFFEKAIKSQRRLFKGKAIEKQKSIMASQGQYPVIYLTLKDLKEPQWDMCFAKIQHLLGKLVHAHKAVLDSAQLDAIDHQSYEALLEGKAPQEILAGTLSMLSRVLYEQTQKKVIILIDEYDVPIHSGYQYGYYEDSVAFMRSFLSGAFKDNPYLEKGVITGIFCVAKESLFSGLNNLGVYGMLSPEFATEFGFTENEVRCILRHFDVSEQLADVQSWYNGYDFGGHTIYNPWSIVQFASRSSSGLMPYWLNTASYHIIEDLITSNTTGIQHHIEELIQGHSITSSLNDNIVLSQVQSSATHILSFLTFSGYLKASNPRREGEEPKLVYDLEIPNQEVSIFYRDVMQQWLHQSIGNRELHQMLKCLTQKNLEEFGLYLKDMIRQFLSYHDTAGKAPERVHHAFVLGLLMQLGSDYDIRSNQESGYGRYDLMMLPKAPKKPGFIFEFKRVLKEHEETPEDALKSALQQIHTQCYADEMRKQKIQDITAIAVVVNQKRAWICHEAMS